MMHIFWSAEESITSVEVLRRATNKDWKDNSLHPMLQRLIKKGFIQEDGVIREGRAFARTFEPIISCEEYYRVFFAERSKDAGLPTLLSALIGCFAYIMVHIKNACGRSHTGIGRLNGCPCNLWPAK